MKVLALIDRDAGRSRAMVIDRVDTATIKPNLLENISPEAHFLSTRPPITSASAACSPPAPA